MGCNPVAVTSTSDITAVSRKDFFEIGAAIECRFTLKYVRDMITKHRLLQYLGAYARNFDETTFILFLNKRQ